MSVLSVHRKMMAEAEQSYAHVDLRYSAAQALVVPTALTRGIITAIAWISPLVYPTHTFAETATAKEWVSAELADALLDFPSGARWSSRRGWTPP